jgi:hypothetical protein
VDRARDEPRARRSAGVVGEAQPGALRVREREPRAVLGPLVRTSEALALRRRERADVCDLDADGPRVRRARVPGLLGEVERLVERPVDVEQEVRKLRGPPRPPSSTIGGASA